MQKPSLKDFEYNLACMWNECNYTVVWTFFGIALVWDWNENWSLPVLWLKDELPRPVDVQDATGEEWRNSSRKNEEAESKQKQHPVVDVTGDGSRVWCCKEQYCLGTWNVRTMNQGKLEVVKQEMARVNIDILGISELKWTGMGGFNSDRPLYLLLCARIP